MRLRWGLCWLAVCCSLSQVGLFAQSTEEPSAVGDSNHIDSTPAVPTAPDPSADPQTRTKVAPPTAGNVSNVAPVRPYVFPDKAKITKYWIRNSFGGRAFLGSSLRGTWNTWVHETPEEWGQGVDGFSRRFGTGYLENVTNHTALVLLSGAMHQDPIYYHCSCTGVWPRSGHAAKLAFVARNHSGDGVISAPKIISPFFGPMITRNTIYPDRYNSGDAAISGATYFIGRIGWNILREFFTKGEKW